MRLVDFEFKRRFGFCWFKIRKRKEKNNIGYLFVFKNGHWDPCTFKPSSSSLRKKRKTLIFLNPNPSPLATAAAPTPSQPPCSFDRRRKWIASRAPSSATRAISVRSHSSGSHRRSAAFRHNSSLTVARQAIGRAGRRQALAALVVANTQTRKLEPRPPQVRLHSRMKPTRPALPHLHSRVKLTRPARPRLHRSRVILHIVEFLHLKTYSLQPRPPTSLLGKRDFAVRTRLSKSPWCMLAYPIRVVPACVSFGITTFFRTAQSDGTANQIVLGVPLGSPKTSYVPPGSHIARIRERASYWAGAEVRAKASWRATKSDRGEP
ncbi:hypothetical protein E5676_scaffold1737G00630 [Cucumis melo var. makuwa]|uniref:Uncharacterized protein n=1 Tax=Cucumis melo var. makuwa TaxID=1194695 RepID=A0A5D3C7C2_CUCMM|nr:hypothetical protein E6C27_scaffold673G001300 [Cucumis melo var. makuwa]TYK07781.1 hypothetical protein E5676_scaffold1737G00630 [Cucumis melo var. makuwa]